MPAYTISGRVVAPDGSALTGVVVSVKQLADLNTGPALKGSATTNNGSSRLWSWRTTSWKFR